MILLLVGSLAAQPDPVQFELRIPREKVQLYFGEKYENATHFGLHFGIALWRPDYSLVAAVSIETAQTLGGRFELNDWISRLGGCLAGYLVKRFIFKTKKRTRR